MDVPLEIRFHNIDSSEAIEAAIRERAARLERLYDRLTSCRVAVEAPHRQHRKGNVYTVTINMGVPRGELMVNKEPHKPKERYANPDLYKAIRDAFDAAERQLVSYKQKLGGVEVKPHDALFHGQVSEVHPERDFGFLMTATGSQLYFHRNSIMDVQLEDMRPGTPVHYVEAMADNGPHASKVWVSPPHQET